LTTIILSYRREDTELMVGRICDRLRDHHGLLDGALAAASGWRGARPNARFVPLILNGMVELLLGAWVALQRLGIVRVDPYTAWPPSDFWIDFLLAGALLVAAAPGLNVRYGRFWLIAAGIVFADSRRPHHDDFELDRLRLGRRRDDEAGRRLAAGSRVPAPGTKPGAGGSSVMLPCVQAR
jgi:hypothetical protein